MQVAEETFSLSELCDLEKKKVQMQIAPLLITTHVNGFPVAPRAAVRGTC